MKNQAKKKAAWRHGAARRQNENGEKRNIGIGESMKRRMTAASKYQRRPA
jgi:hypothetical protein